MTDSDTPRTDALEPRQGAFNESRLATLARDLERENARLRDALEFALEMQGAVEDSRPDGYGSPRNTIAWIDNAVAALNP